MDLNAITFAIFGLVVGVVLFAAAIEPVPMPKPQPMLVILRSNTPIEARPITRERFENLRRALAWPPGLTLDLPDRFGFTDDDDRIVIYYYLDFYQADDSKIDRAKLVPYPGKMLAAAPPKYLPPTQE